MAAAPSNRSVYSPSGWKESAASAAGLIYVNTIYAGAMTAMES
jgi:hypothetical protein